MFTHRSSSAFGAEVRLFDFYQDNRLIISHFTRLFPPEYVTKRASGDRELVRTV